MVTRSLMHRMPPQVGDWTARTVERGFTLRATTKWHKIESVINGEAVTKCGRVMGGDGMVIGYGFQAEAQCHYCGPEF